MATLTGKGPSLAQVCIRNHRLPGNSCNDVFCQEQQSRAAAQLIVRLQASSWYRKPSADELFVMKLASRHVHDGFGTYPLPPSGLPQLLA